MLCLRKKLPYLFSSLFSNSSHSGRGAVVDAQSLCERSEIVFLLGRPELMDIVDDAPSPSLVLVWEEVKVF